MGLDLGTQELGAGELHAQLVGADLFAVTWRGTEVLQRMYYAVRDAPWNPIPGQLTEADIKRSADGFVVRLKQEHRYQDIDVLLDAEVEGRADGTLEYRAASTFRADFMYSKIGLNLHHGMDQYRGRTFVANALSGSLEGRFDEAIAPQLIRDGTLTAMFAHFDALEVGLGDVGVRFEFEGDRFETQDHRNWCDANWKTYGTPLEYGFPMTAKRGQRLSQVARLRCTGGQSPTLRRARGSAVEASLGVSAGRLPAIGVALDEMPSEQAAAALRSIQPAFVRHSVPHDRSVEYAVGTGRAIVDAIGVALELVVQVAPDQSAERARELVGALAHSGLPVARLVCLASGAAFSEFRGATPPEIVTPFVDALAANGLTRVPVFSGASQSYNVIARDRPDYPDGVGIAFAATPQIHACDDTSVMQNARAFADVIADCRRLYPGRTVAVTPVHLAAAEGPFPAGPPAHEDDRPQDDPRHGSSFGAAWAVAALSSLATAETESVTMFDAVGLRGVITPTGERHPVASVLATLGGRLGCAVRRADVTSPDAVGVLDVDGADGRTVLVANLRPQPQEVRVRQAPANLRVRYIDDAEPAGSATQSDPRVVGDDMVLLLSGYATAVLSPGT